MNSMEFIKDLANKLKTQSNRATQNVGFAVYDTKRIYWIDSNYNYDWKERPEEPEYEELCHNCQAKRDNDEDIPEECDYCCDANYNFYREVEQIDDRAGVFLTAEACQKHIDENRHHYHNPKVYWISFWRNPEMVKLISCIFDLAWVEKPGHYSDVD